jgi:hypothetical protein
MVVGQGRARGEVKPRPSLTIQPSIPLIALLYDPGGSRLESWRLPCRGRASPAPPSPRPPHCPPCLRTRRAQVGTIRGAAERGLHALVASAAGRARGRARLVAFDPCARMTECSAAQPQPQAAAHPAPMHAPPCSPVLQRQAGAAPLRAAAASLGGGGHDGQPRGSRQPGSQQAAGAVRGRRPGSAVLGARPACLPRLPPPPLPSPLSVLPLPLLGLCPACRPTIPPAGCPPPPTHTPTTAPILNRPPPSPPWPAAGRPPQVRSQQASPHSPRPPARAHHRSPQRDHRSGLRAQTRARRRLQGRCRAASSSSSQGAREASCSCQGGRQAGGSCQEAGGS